MTDQKIMSYELSHYEDNARASKGKYVSFIRENAPRYGMCRMFRFSRAAYEKACKSSS